MKHFLVPLIFLLASLDVKAETVFIESNCADCTYTLMYNKTSQSSFAELDKQYTTFGEITNGQVITLDQIYGNYFFVAQATTPDGLSSTLSDEITFNVSIKFINFEIIRN